MNKKKFLKYLFLPILFIVGWGLQFAYPASKDVVNFLTPFFLITIFIWYLYFLKSSYRLQSVLLLFFVIFIISWGIEAIGVETGLIFGTYTYGDVLGIKLFSAPLLIGVLWFLVVSPSTLVFRQFSGLRSSFIVTALFVGLYATVLDFLIEPIAIELGYWSWQGGSVPLQNYLAWFVIASLLSILVSKFIEVSTKKINKELIDVSKVLMVLLFLHFAILNLFRLLIWNL